MACVTRPWAGVDSVWEQEKLEAKKRLLNCAFDFRFETAFHTVLQKAMYWDCLTTQSVYVSPEQYVLPLQLGHVL